MAKLKYTVVTSRARVDVDISRFDGQMERAQMWLGWQVLQDCRSKMPHLTGSLQQRSYVDDNGRKVVFPGPYGRMQYGGVAMVDAATGKGPRRIPVGPGGEYIYRFRKGAKLKPTDRPLVYTSPAARAHWFEVAKAENLDHWLAQASKLMGGK